MARRFAGHGTCLGNARQTCFKSIEVSLTIKIARAILVVGGMPEFGGKKFLTKLFSFGCTARPRARGAFEIPLSAH
jgi:hypothetical protein